MQRLTARFLLLVALVGTILPAALQATVTPQHSCCRRRADHHCTEPASPDETVIRTRSCCGGECSRAVTTAQWAHPEPPTSGFQSSTISIHKSDSRSIFHALELLSSRSTRAPPQLSIA